MKAFAIRAKALVKFSETVHLRIGLGTYFSIDENYLRIRKNT